MSAYVASEQNCGLDAVHAPGERIRRLSFPAIGQLVPSNQLPDRHFVVVLSVEKDAVRLVDPSREQVATVPIQEFIESATGNYLVRKDRSRDWLIAAIGSVVAVLVLLLRRRALRTGAESFVALSSVVLLWCCGCGGEVPAPQKHSLLMVEPDRVDLGLLQPNGDPQATFTVRNISRRALKVAIASQSCGCLEAKIAHETLEPNESTECLVQFRLRNKSPGTFHESTTIAVPEFHESHELHCGGFVQGASIFGESTTLFSKNGNGKNPVVIVDAFHLEKSCEVRVETVELTIPGIEPLISEIHVQTSEKLLTGGFRRRISIPLKIEDSRASGRGVISISISVAGERHRLNADLNYIHEK